MKNTLYFLFLMVLISSCQTDLLSPIDLRAYSIQPDNGLIQATTVGDWTYQLRYIPHELQALRSLDKNNFNSTVFDKALDKVSGHHYLILTIEHANQAIKDAARQNMGEQNFLKAWSQFQFQSKNDFKLIKDHQALNCVLYHLEQTSIHQRSVQLTLVFRDKNENLFDDFENDIKLTFNDHFFSEQVIQMTIPKMALNNIPRLKI